MRKSTAVKRQPIGVLGEYRSVWDGAGDELEQFLIGQELRKNHRRSIAQIRRAVTVRYWIQVLRWTLEDMRVYFPLFGGILLALILLFIALY
ncbi:hypothetical protein EHV15_34320 [Paenibacillus oralis]|uniref:Uncharacterized protein n=1 Tax=Paenibacillus oralis TaxID=2490856 RepID=A0A3P3T9F2_9BACL|nr:hypothetical protein [Paenibacillus oralis]RRJ54675.1 hypothetical protein EHV15_34320 [Paenibacillus oralis]